MNIFKRLILFIKNVFTKDAPKVLEAPKEIISDEKKTEFIDSLKISTTNTNNSNQENEIETLVCHGDGLGIQNKMSY